MMKKNIAEEWIQNITCICSIVFEFLLPDHNMEAIEKQRETALGLLKSKTENEFLVKIGAKEEEVDLLHSLLKL